MAISSNFPTTRPSLILDFQKSEVVDPRITFTRTSSATRFNQYGVLETVANNVPRIDFNPTTLLCNGLLIEEQRTNLLLQSQNFLTTWATAGSGSPSVTINTAVSPNGTTDADTVSGTGSNSDRVQQTVTIAASTKYVLSFFVKNISATQSKFHINCPNSGITDSETYIDWSGSTITGFTTNGGSAVGVAIVYPNNWYRVYFVFTTNASDAGTATVRFYPNGVGADGTSKSVYLWGAQLEAGASITSYILTAAATVTRQAEFASMTGTNFSSWYNPLEGTLYVESSSAMANATFPRFTTISDNTINESIRISGSGDTLFGGGRVDDGGASQASLLLFPVLPNIKYKHALAYKANDFAYIANSTTSITHDTSGTVPTVDRIHIGSDNYGAQLNGHVLKVSYYPSRLSNTQLTALTRT